MSLGVTLSLSLSLSPLTFDPQSWHLQKHSHSSTHFFYYYTRPLILSPSFLHLFLLVRPPLRSALRNPSASACIVCLVILFPWMRRILCKMEVIRMCVGLWMWHDLTKCGLDRVITIGIGRVFLMYQALELQGQQNTKKRGML